MTPPCDSSSKPLHADTLLQRFEYAWRHDEPPRIQDFLPKTVEASQGDAEPQRRALLEELVMLDLEYRWSRAVNNVAPPSPPNARPRLEEYIECFPELGPVTRLPGELIGTEYRVRHRWGDQPDHGEYTARFGSHPGLIGLLKQIDGDLAAEFAESDPRPAIPVARAVLAPVARPVASALTIAEFVDLLGRYRLLAPAEWDEVSDRLRHQYSQARALARDLLQRGWLTAYQINQLFLSNGQGLVLGPYILIERLGEGGTGQVFKARHQHLGRTVALKVIRRELLTDPEVVGRFCREVQILSRLSHPHVVHAYDAGPVGDTHFLTMEYVSGIDLAKLVRNIGPLPASRAIDYAHQTALGLDHIHQHGLVHRDIKPHNLLIADCGLRIADCSFESAIRNPQSAIVKILDLGLARIGLGAYGEAGFGSSLTPVGAVLMGTLDYMAPEQALDFHQADIRSDIYSLGCTLYFLLIGQAPFGGGTVAQRLLQHQQAEPTPAESLRRDLPPELGPVLRKMLAKRPEDRYQTPAEAAGALEPLVEIAAQRERQRAVPLEIWLENSQNGTPSVYSSPVSPQRPRLRRGSSRRKLLLAIAGLILLGLGAVLTIGPSKPPPSREASAAGPKPTPASRQVGALVIEPEPLALLPGAPLCKSALVSRPAPVEGVRSWTIETRAPRGAVKELAYSPNGRWLATASEDHVIRLWRPTGTAPVLRLLVGHDHFDQPNQRIVLGWSPDSRYLASGGQADRTLRFWEIETGRPLRTVPLPGPVMGLAWSPDGRKIACGCQNHPAVLLLDPTNGRRLFSLEGHQGAIGGLAWSPDGKQLASGSEDRTIRLWDAVSGRALQTFTGHTGYITRMTWSPDGKMLASTAQVDDAVRVWEIASGKLLATAPNRNPGGIADLAWAPDSKTLAFCDGGAHFWEPSSGRPPRAVPSGIALNGISRSPDGNVLAVGGLPQGGGRGVVEMWNTATSTLLQTLDGHQLWTTGQQIVWSPDGRLLAAVDYPFAGVSLWDAATGQCLATLSEHTNHCMVAAWSPDGRMLATGSLDHDVRLWDTAGGKMLLKLAGHTGPIAALCWSPDGKELASGSSDRTVRVWDAVSGKNPHILSAHQDTVRVLAWSPDGKKLASGAGDADRTVRLWETATGTPLHQPLEHPRSLSALAWSADGKWLAAGTQHEGNALVWNATTGRLEKTLPGYQAGSVSLAWLADDGVLAAVCSDQKVRQWDFTAGQLLRTTDLPARGTLSPDRRTLAGMTWPTVRLWDVQTSRTAGSFLLLGPDLWLAVTANGQYQTSAGFANDLVIVVQTDDSQEMLSPIDFARRFSWKNERKRVKLLPQ